MELKEFFTNHPNVAVAFSGGVDSAYLLYVAKKYAKKVIAYYVKSEFQPDFELRDATNFANKYDITLRIIDLKILQIAEIKNNPPNRCYYCKKIIFNSIIERAKLDGFNTILEGTNASDDISDRPGFKALEELKVYSPIKTCGLTKDKIIALSKKAKLFTYKKASYACLATRIYCNEEITKDKLCTIEVCEKFLFEKGFKNFRIRVKENNAKIQLEKKDLKKILKKREEILEYLKKYFETICLDLEVRK